MCNVALFVGYWCGGGRVLCGEGEEREEGVERRGNWGLWGRKVI